MAKLHIFRALLLGLFLGSPVFVVPAFAQSLEEGAKTFDRLADVTRQADRSRDVYQRALDNSAADVDRWKQDWLNRERNLEDLRVKALSEYGKVKQDSLRALRDSGTSWADLARRYNLEPSRLGYGFSRYDHDRDSWKGTPPGLAKKGGIPSGLAKQGHDDQFHDRGPNNSNKKGKDNRNGKNHKGGKGKNH